MEWYICLDGKVSSVGAGALGGARPVHALCDVVGMLPRGTVCAHAGGPVSRGPAVLGEQAGHEAGLPGLGGVELGLLGHGGGGQQDNGDNTILHSTKIHYLDNSFQHVIFSTVAHYKILHFGH